MSKFAMHTAINTEFAFPCNICANNKQPVGECLKCGIYELSTEQASDILADVEQLINKGGGK